MKNGELTHGELFAGISGFGLGFAASGIRTVWRVEIDRDCQRVLRHHYPDDALLSDVRECGRHNLTPVDIISFGSPCQDFSCAGKRAGLAGGRSGLIHEAFRILRELPPAFAVWENVPGVLSSNAGRDFAAILRAFRECGARDVAWRILDSRHFGVPQRRRRVFVVADFRGERAGEVLFESPCGCGHPAQGRAAGPGLAPAVTPGARRASGQGAGEQLTLASPLTAGSAVGDGVNRPGRRREDDDVGPMGSVRTGHDATTGVPFVVNAAESNAAQSHARESDTARCLDAGGGFATNQGGTVVMQPEPRLNVVVLDTATGRTATDDRWDWYWWTQGNGSCDCNRRLLFEPDEPCPGECIGCRRYLVVAVDGRPSGQEFNAGYPPQLFAELGESHATYQDTDTASNLRTSGGGGSTMANLVTGITLHGSKACARTASETDTASTLRRRTPGQIENSTTTVIQSGMTVRRLTTTETLRLQGLPDEYLDLEPPLSDSAKYRLTGNGVSRPVAEWLGVRIILAGGEVRA